MKRSLYPILLVVITLIIGCQKVDNIDKRPFSYELSGFHDGVIASNAYCEIPINAKLITGDPREEPITMTISELPEQMYADSATIHFRLNYTPTFILRAKGATQGTYSLKITTSNANTGTRIDSMKLLVGPAVSCIDQLVSSSEAVACDKKTYAHIDSVAGAFNRIKIRVAGLFDLPDSAGSIIPIYADVDCSTLNVIVPPQMVNGATVRGRGYYKERDCASCKAEFLYLEDTLTDGATTKTCSINIHTQASWR